MALSDTLTPPSSMTPRAIQVRASDAHQHAASLQSLDQDYEQLSRGSFSGTLSSVSITGVTVFVEQLGSAVFQTGATSADSLTIAAACDLSGDAYWNGCYLDRRAVIGFAANREFTLRTPETSRCVGLSVPNTRLENLLPGVSSSDWHRLLQSKDCCTDDRDAGHRVADRLTHLYDVGNDAGLVRDGDFGELLDDLLVELWQVFSASGFDGRKLRMQSYPRIAMRARNAMLARLAEPSDIEQLAHDLGCSRRALQYALQSVFGMRPIEYLRTLRLSAARQLLLQPTTATTVQDAAEECGLFHLPRFARDYARMFSELPSQTLARSRVRALC
jgi:AraC family ethanolamine operon transcriptional activator